MNSRFAARGEVLAKVNDGTSGRVTSSVKMIIQKRLETSPRKVNNLGRWSRLKVGLLWEAPRADNWLAEEMNQNCEGESDLRR